MSYNPCPDPNWQEDARAADGWSEQLQAPGGWLPDPNGQLGSTIWDNGATIWDNGGTIWDPVISDLWQEQCRG